MRKKILCFILSGFLFLLIGCSTTTTLDSTTLGTTTPPETTTTTEEPYVYDPLEVSAAVLEEERLSFKFFWEVVNGNPDSAGYGMISARYNVDNGAVGAASIASIGFGLSALLAGIEYD